MKFQGRILSVCWMVLAGPVFGQTVTINQAVLTSNNNQVETTIAINPTDKNKLIGGAVIVPPSGNGNVSYYYSLDGGNTWGGNEAFPTAGSKAADPVVAFDGYGVAYYLYQVRDDNKLYLHKSTNSGQSWPSYRRTVAAKTFPKSVDKPWMAISPVKNANNQYEICVVYTETDANAAFNNPIWEAVSSDSGTSFTNSLCGGANASGAMVAYGPTGSRYIAWGEFRTTNPFDQISIKFSFSSATIPITQIGTYKKIGQDNRFVLKNSEVRVNSFPSMDVDRSEGPRRGTIYVAWADKRFGDPDILLIKSTDNGATWSSPVRVNTDAQNNQKDQWFPYLNVDPDGNVNIIFYDSRGSADNQSAQLCFARSTDGGATFSNTLIGSLFTVASTPGGNFMGDYIQLANWTGKSYPFWMRWDGTKYQAFFTEMTMPTVNVTVKNDFSGAQYGNFTVIEYPNNSVTYPSGTAFSWPNPSLRKIQATDRYNNPFGDGKNWKYRDWNNDLTDRTNPKVFQINTQTSFITAFFRKIYPITTQTDLEATGNHSGTVQFKDPLGTNAYETKTSPFFRDDVFEQETQTPYGIGAFSTLTNLLSTDWYFQNWSDGLALQHNITVTGPITYTAKYKGHLRSNSSTTLSSNNQRKMVWDGTKYHMVYESMGEIWYMATTGDNDNWGQEVLISDGNGGNKYPSIDLINGIVVVVWQKESPSTGKICMRRKTAGGWQAQQEVSSFLASAGFTATPVVAVYSAPYYFIIWHDYDNNNLTIRSYNESSGTFGTETAISSTNGNSFYPALAADTYGKLHLAWSESGKIYYSKISHSGGGNYSYEVNKEEVTLNYGSFSTHSFPAITTDYSRRPNVVWEEYHSVTYVRSIVHRRRELSGSWSSFTTFSPNDDEYLKPSIGSHFNISNNNSLEVGWYVLYTNQLKLAKYNGTSWSQFTQTPSGQFPGMSQDLSTTTPVKAKMVYRGVSGTPFALVTTSQNLPKTTDQLHVHYRRGVLGIGGAELSFDLGEFDVSGTKINLFPYVDTLAVGHTGQWEEMFRTESFQVSDQTNLRFLRKFDVKNPEPLKNVLPIGAKVEFRLEAVDAPSNQVLAVIDRQEITRNVPPPSNERRDVVLRLAGNKEVFLRVGLGIPAGIKPLQAMVESYIETKSDSVSKSLAENPTQVELTPTQFALIQNYPNPFNPETVIKYMLPNSGYVTLRVFNIQGQEVTTLVDAYQSAGRYEVSWDGRDHSRRPVAAGLYFYQIQAGDFRQVQRMVLLK